jgi:hypothetical protein
MVHRIANNLATDFVRNHLQIMSKNWVVGGWLKIGRERFAADHVMGLAERKPFDYWLLKVGEPAGNCSTWAVNL